MAILADITSQFVPEVPACGSASKCYCIKCTRIRAKTFKLFAAWRQVARASHPKDPAPMKLNYFENHYATCFQEYNVLVGVVQDAGNCNGSYAAHITVQIMSYATDPSCKIVFNEYLGNNVTRPIWMPEPEILTYWYDPEREFWNGTGWRWVYLKRRRLFRILFESMEDSLMPDMKHAFEILKNSVPKLMNGKFKNKMYIFSPSQVIIPDSSKTIELYTWPQYWMHYEAAFGL